MIFSSIKSPIHKNPSLLPKKPRSDYLFSSSQIFKKKGGKVSEKKRTKKVYCSIPCSSPSLPLLFNCNPINEENHLQQQNLISWFTSQPPPCQLRHLLIIDDNHDFPSAAASSICWSPPAICSAADLVHPQHLRLPPSDPSRRRQPATTASP